MVCKLCVKKSPMGPCQIMGVYNKNCVYTSMLFVQPSRRTLDVTSHAIWHSIVCMDVHVHMHTHILQGEELLSACCDGSTADVSALLEKGVNVHYIDKVKRVNSIYNHMDW